jgi:hypothetical protein
LYRSAASWSGERFAEIVSADGSSNIAVQPSAGAGGHAVVDERIGRFALGFGRSPLGAGRG